MKAILYLALLASWSMGSQTMAQNYSLEWFSLNSAAAESSGGTFWIDGAAGLVVIGRLTADKYSLDAGSLALIALPQSTTGPLLRATLSATNTIVLAWPTAANGFRLQQNSNASNANWTDVGSSTFVVGSENQAVLPISGRSKFFRLKLE